MQRGFVVWIGKEGRRMTTLMLSNASHPQHVPPKGMALELHPGRT